jgi:ABC-type phosphate/phosphonate transport system substrate-binding protein
MFSATLVLGAVAYDPKVVTIWEGFRRYFARHGFSLDYILYSNYERQVEALLAGQIDVAWNSPLAWVRAERLATSCGQVVRALAMRDTDRDARSVIVVRADAPIRSSEDLRGRVVAVGAADSPQATLLPLAHLQRVGIIPDVDFTVLRHDVLSGLHGDHVGGERDAAQALMSGEADAACLLDANYQAFIGDGLFPPFSTVVLTQTEPFDHCNMTAGPSATQTLLESFTARLLQMSYDDPEVRPLFELEGLTRWLPARLEGYRALAAAVDAFHFYDKDGSVLYEAPRL